MSPAMDSPLTLDDATSTSDLIEYTEDSITASLCPTNYPDVAPEDERAIRIRPLTQEEL
jgi:hypothetical protein